MPSLRRALRASTVALVAAVFAVLPTRAWAFPWMVHHGYTNCAQCHVDPSGAGLLTDYGRAQGEVLLRSQYKGMPADPDHLGKFLWGAVNLPNVLKLQADVRSLGIPDPQNPEWILMQADLRGGIVAGNFLSSASIGVVNDGAFDARITSFGKTGDWGLVSREYWVGYQFFRGFTLKGGRMYLPFGLRTEHHILYTRDATNTNTNADGQVGLAANYTTKKLRLELMGIAGNFQVSPDDFRKRGYSFSGSYAISKTFEVGVSSLFTTSLLDEETLAPRTFMSEGVTLRTAPVEPLAILFEGDVLLDNQDGTTLTGLASNLTLDYEAVQGLHIQGIGEYADTDFASQGRSYNGELGVQWFFLPHVDFRVDGGYGMVLYNATEPGLYGLLQGHVYL